MQFFSAMKYLCIILFMCSFIVIVLCTKSSKPIKYHVHGMQRYYMKLYLDHNTKPCSNFYQHACGNYKHRHIKKTDNQFSVLANKVKIDLKVLLTSQSEKQDSTSAHLKASHMYASCIDESQIREIGIEPLLNIISNGIGVWPAFNLDWNLQEFDWRRMIAHLKLFNIDALFVQSILPDPKNVKSYIINFDRTPCMGSEICKNKVVRYIQKKYIADVLNLIGLNWNVANKTAEEIVEFDKQLNIISLNAIKTKNSEQKNLRITLEELENKIPNFGFIRFLEIIQNRTVNKSETVIINKLQYFQQLPDLIALTKPRIVANFLIWTFVRSLVQMLDNRYEILAAEFIEIMNLVTKSSILVQPKSREEFCTNLVSFHMNIAVNSMYFEKFFNNAVDEDTYFMTLIDNIKAMFRETFNNTKWLDDISLNSVLNKFENIQFQIGYSKNMLSTENVNKLYEKAIISKNNYLGNLISLHFINNKIIQQSLNLSTDEWPYFVPKRNPIDPLGLYYSRTLNQINIPPVLLQQPFYDPLLPRAINYGALGQLISHEILHAFDYTGHNFDMEWTNQTKTEFVNKTNCLINQHNEMGIYGQITLDEDIADNGGWRIAYKIFKKFFNQQEFNVKDELLHGMSYRMTQLFFIAAAQIWCTSGDVRPKYWKNHPTRYSPNSLRVNGVVSNMKEFAKAFHCRKGTPMNPKNKCVVW